MSDKYTSSGLSNANLAPDVGRDFANARQQQDYQLTQLSQETQNKAQMLNDIYDKRTKQEWSSQQRSRQFRELKQKVQMLEDYVREDAPRPNTPEAREHDLQIIDDKAKEMVAQREEYFLEKIERERHEMLEQVIKEAEANTPSAQASAPSQEAEIDHEQER